MLLKLLRLAGVLTTRSSIHTVENHNPHLNNSGLDPILTPLFTPHLALIETIKIRGQMRERLVGQLLGRKIHWVARGA